ncbi:hypothetical protein AVEN_235476-1 [Araneus ventricosus]|uniref:Uncharacterized protein n=1 Tax=Araneus ventricosus TaxID=182803 RepID=A0A4Y2A447_ARAVE|nr:hypothetical protein AVEN_235476-1 [Araneus ventricosus]
MFLRSLFGRGGLVVRSRPQGKRLPGSKPDFTENTPCMGLLQAKSYVVANRPPACVVRKFGEEVPAQMSSSSDQGSKSRRPSENSLLVASKWDVNVTKLN